MPSPSRNLHCAMCYRHVIIPQAHFEKTKQNFTHASPPRTTGLHSPCDPDQLWNHKRGPVSCLVHTPVLDIVRCFGSFQHLICKLLPGTDVPTSTPCQSRVVVVSVRYLQIIPTACHSQSVLIGVELRTGIAALVQNLSRMIFPTGHGRLVCSREIQKHALELTCHRL